MELWVNEVFFPYHHKKIEVSLSPKNLASGIRPQKMSLISDAPQAITIALDDPRDQYSLIGLLKEGKGGHHRV